MKVLISEYPKPQKKVNVDEVIICDDPFASRTPKPNTVVCFSSDLTIGEFTEILDMIQTADRHCGMRLYHGKKGVTTSRYEIVTMVSKKKTKMILKKFFKAK
jgi:hypothetical protein